MTADKISPATDANPDTASAAPNWDHVPFDIGCARCGHDLRGLSDPACPACGLDFDWADTVPIERVTCLHCDYHLYGLQDTRCPECGERFTWDEVLTAYRTRQKPLFEYHWRERPVRSLVSTWVRTLRPSKFWQSIDIHDPPQLRPLIVVVIVALVLFAAAVPICAGMQGWLFDRLWWTRSGQAGAPSVMDILSYILSTASNPSLYIPTAFAVLWCAMSFAALMIFRQSMRLCKVRTIHVVRVWAYSVPPMLPLLIVGPALCYYVNLFLTLAPNRGQTGNLDSFLGVGFILAFITHVVWSLRQGYHRYLRMRHSLGVAIASQMIAMLATAGFPPGAWYLLFGW